MFTLNGGSQSHSWGTDNIEKRLGYKLVMNEMASNKTKATLAKMKTSYVERHTFNDSLHSNNVDRHEKRFTINRSQ